MASVTYEHVYKRWGEVVAVNDLSLDIADKEFMVYVGPSGCGKSTILAVAGRSGRDQRGHNQDRRPRRQRCPAQRSGYRHGVPVLRAVSAHERVRQHGVRAEAAQDAEEGDRRQGQGSRRSPRHRPTAGPQAQSALRRPAPACGCGPRHRARTRTSSSSTNRSPTWTPSCASKPAPTSPVCTSNWRPPSSTSPTIRWKP